jgi:hypothetical protein
MGSVPFFLPKALVSRQSNSEPRINSVTVVSIIEPADFTCYQITIILRSLIMAFLSLPRFWFFLVLLGCAALSENATAAVCTNDNLESAIKSNLDQKIDRVLMSFHASSYSVVDERPDIGSFWINPEDTTISQNDLIFLRALAATGYINLFENQSHIEVVATRKTFVLQKKYGVSDPTMVYFAITEGGEYSLKNRELLKSR